MTIAGDDVDALIVQIKEFVQASVIGESDYDSLLAAKCLLIKLVTRLYYRTHSIIVLLHSICFSYISIMYHIFYNRSIIGLVVKFPLAMREPRVR